MFKSGSLYVQFLWGIWNILINLKQFETAMQFRLSIIKDRYNIEV